jgi:ascorbate-specific PTS system EIIC-type component UlaA
MEFSSMAAAVFFEGSGGRRSLLVLSGNTGSLDLYVISTFLMDLCVVGQLSMYPLLGYLYSYAYVYVFLIQ